MPHYNQFWKCSCWPKTSDIHTRSLASSYFNDRAAPIVSLTWPNTSCKTISWPAVSHFHRLLQVWIYQGVEKTLLSPVLFSLLPGFLLPPEPVRDLGSHLPMHQWFSVFFVWIYVYIASHCTCNVACRFNTFVSPLSFLSETYLHLKSY